MTDQIYQFDILSSIPRHAAAIGNGDRHYNNADPV